MVPMLVSPCESRENEDTKLTDPVPPLAEPSSRLTPLNDADEMMLTRLCCCAVMSLWTCVGSVPGVWAVTRSALILFRMSIVLFRAVVAVPTVDDPRFRESVTAESAPVSDFMVLAIDQ